MGGSSHSDWEEITPHGVSAAKTVVLVGKTGNGKSATGNTIIGRKVFDSKPSFGGVTSICQLETTTLDGQTLHVIDTPGMFDSAVEHHILATEIARCIDMAKDGLHAVVLVLSIGSRFSEEEASAFESLFQIFGDKIADYIIVAFSRGDLLLDNMSLNDFLRDAPMVLKDTLQKFGYRTLVFDNMTEDDSKIYMQRKKLISLVDTVLDCNGGKPFTNDLFAKFKKEKEQNLADQTTEGKLPASNGVQLDRLIEMVETTLKESIARLEKQLAEERACRAQAEEKAKAAQDESVEEIRKLFDLLKGAEERCTQLEEKLNKSCSIM